MSVHWTMEAVNTSVSTLMEATTAPVTLAMICNKTSTLVKVLLPECTKQNCKAGWVDLKKTFSCVLLIYCSILQISMSVLFSEEAANTLVQTLKEATTALVSLAIL